MQKILIITFAVMVLLCGCKSGPEVVAYKTIGTIALSVNGAKHAYETYRAAGKVTVEQDLQVRSLYLKYQGAMKVAEDLQKSVKTNGDKALYDQIVASVNAVSSDFMAAVALYVPSSKPIP